MALIQLRRDSSAAWSTVNPVLATGEIGFETDTLLLKVGDGSTAWNSLGYFGLGANTFTGTQSLGGNIIDEPRLQSVRETYGSPAISSGSLTLDLDSANNFYTSLNADITSISITNVPNSTVEAYFKLELISDGTARAITWPNSFTWLSGTVPAVPSTNGAKTVLIGYTNDGGANWSVGTNK